MIWSSRLLGVLLAVVVTFSLSTVAAAELSESYTVEGVEIAATSTQGTFVGSGKGTTNGDDAVWQAIVGHEVLEPKCYSNGGCAITGGTFSLVNENVEAVSGTFAAGGSITLHNQAPGCGIQVFSVDGTLTNVTTLTTTGGTGTFTATLTHFRTRFLGRCTTVFAKVSGTVTFDFPQ
jgi:hypothetical protein